MRCGAVRWRLASGVFFSDLYGSTAVVFHVSLAAQQYVVLYRDVLHPMASGKGFQGTEG